MDNLRPLGDRISVPIPADEDGLTGRECPNSQCEGYFKVQFGTGVKEPNLPCHCPYCGHTAGHDHFWTKEQIEFAKSVAVRRITDAVVADLKKLEFDVKPRGPFGIGVSMKLKASAPIPIRYYREKELETTLECDNCTLRYSVYGLFAYCPDCGTHNSEQILAMNLELARKELRLGGSQTADLQRHLFEDALENAVSAFDGFGRQVVRVRKGLAKDAHAAESLSFQNLAKADDRLAQVFGFRLSANVPGDDWGFALRSFQKRHLLAHRMGVVDEWYIRETGDSMTPVGRRVPVSGDEVERLLTIVKTMGAKLLALLATQTAP